MKYQVNFQNPNNYPNLPNIFHIQRWVSTTLTELVDDGEVSIRIVNSKTIQSLNHQYRNMDKPTNVLSFPCELPEVVAQNLPHRILGDIIICHEVIEKEAYEQEKSVEATQTRTIVFPINKSISHQLIKLN